MVVSYSDEARRIAINIARLPATARWWLNLIVAASAKPAEYQVSKRHLRGRKSVRFEPGVGSPGYAQLALCQSSAVLVNELAGLYFSPP